MLRVKTIIQTSIISLSLVAGVSCQQKSEEKSESAAAENGGEEKVNPSKIIADEIPDYPNLYCQNVNTLKLRTSIDQEMGLLCEGGLPTETLLKFREVALSQEPGDINVITFKLEHIPEEDRTNITLGWAFHTQIRPFEVKSRPLYQYLTEGYNSPSVNFEAETTNVHDESTLDSGLHLFSVDMNYKLNVATAAGSPIVHNRNTEYNLYQVQSGNEEMGLAVEHLADESNSDYWDSKMVTASFNDGSGYNDGVGGAIVVTILQMQFDNKGFPDTAAAAFYDIGRGMAGLMYKGLEN